MPKDRIPSEHNEQVALMQWVKLSIARYPMLENLHAIPNGGARHIAVAKKLKSEGVKKGVPDLCLPHPANDYHGLYIELKRQKASYPTKEQKEWLERLNNAGYKAVVCKGWVEAKEVIEVYLNPRGIKNTQG